MMAHIAEYSPNIRWGAQEVELVLMMWGYKATLRAKIGGNCRGLSIFDSAAEIAFDSLLPANGGAAQIEMTNADGETLHCVDDEGRDEDWLKDMIVSAQIIAWEPPTLNEVRAMNGAAPLPEGDQPWNPN